MAEAEDKPPVQRDPGESGVSTMASVPGDAKGGDKAAIADLLAPIQVAQTERYRRLRLLATGGMGAVHVVQDGPMARTLALKVLHEYLAEQRDHTEMFLREARITGQLDHPNVVPVHDIGVKDGHLYFTMKLVEGRTLLEWVRSFGPKRFPEREELFDLIDVVIKVCDALAFAHDKGVLHCDIKPANVMVGAFGQVYLMDWGVARLLDEERHRPPDEENEDRVVGTPSHMPAEQARGMPLDQRADIFAVGALLYHVLTARAPFRGDSHVQVLAQAFLCRFPHPDHVLGEGVVPAALTRIVLKAMAPDRRDRHASILELKDELLRFVRGGESFEAISYPAGAVVIQEGDEGDDAYIIESGRCEVFKGEEQIRIMGPGEVFGEMAILSPGARTATVRTLEPSVLRRVSEAVMREELRSMKPWMGALVRTLADRFREREDEA